MGAHRYWRLWRFVPRDCGRQVRLSEAWLLAGGVRADAPATLTSDRPPVSGSLADLRDASLATSAVLDAGTILQWDFGSTPTAVDDIRLGAVEMRQFPQQCVLEWSDDGAAWAVQQVYSGMLFPGVGKYTSEDATQDKIVTRLRPRAYLRLEETAGGSFADASGNGYAGTAVASGGSAICIPGQPGLVAGSNAAVKVGYGGYVHLQDPLGQGYAGSWTIRLLFKSDVVTASEGYMRVFGRGLDGYAGGWSMVLSVDPDSKVWCGVFMNGSVYTTTSANPNYTPGAVHDCLMVYDASNNWLSLYVNGERTGIVTTGGGALRDSSVGLVYGLGQADFVYHPASTVDEPACWRRALGEDEIIRLYRQRSLQCDPFARSATPNPQHADTTGAAPPLLYGTLVGGGWARTDFHFDPKAKGRIIGTVKEKSTPDNVPLMRRVRLYRDRDGMLVRETWSNAAGDYVFEHIEEGEPYTVLALDHTHHYRAVVADNLTLENGSVEIAQ